MYVKNKDKKSRFIFEEPNKELLMPSRALEVKKVRYTDWESKKKKRKYVD